MKRLYISSLLHSARIQDRRHDDWRHWEQERLHLPEVQRALRVQAKHVLWRLPHLEHVGKCALCSGCTDGATATRNHWKLMKRERQIGDCNDEISFCEISCWSNSMILLSLTVMQSLLRSAWAVPTSTMAWNDVFLLWYAFKIKFFLYCFFGTIPF
jgi:hypothetical protein